MRLDFICLVLVSIALAACGDDSSVPAGSGGGAASTGVAASAGTTVAASTAASTSTTGGQGGDATGGGGSGDGGTGDGGSGDGGSGDGGSGDGGSGDGGSGDGGSGEGGSTPDPIGCAVCVATECPEIAECIQDPACADGLVCTLTSCIVDGEPDLGCIADCFDGDFEAALGALEALGCIVTTCGDDCGGLVPGA